MTRAWLAPSSAWLCLSAPPLSQTPDERMIYVDRSTSLQASFLQFNRHRRFYNKQSQNTICANESLEGKQLANQIPKLCSAENWYVSKNIFETNLPWNQAHVFKLYPLLPFLLTMFPNPLSPSMKIQFLFFRLHTFLTEVAVRTSIEFNLSDHVLNSHDLPNWQPLDIVMRYLALITFPQIQRDQVKDHVAQTLQLHFELSVQRLELVKDDQKTLQRELELMKRDYNAAVAKLNALEKDVTDLKCRQKEMETFTPFIWKVSGFWERVRRAKNDRDIRLESEPFYVGHQGYKMKLAMYPNGTKEAKNAYISFYIAVMKGKYDAILPWPFRYKVTITIIDQNPDPLQRNDFVKAFIPEPTWTSMQRPTSDENERRGFGRFFSHEKLRTGSYIVDDTLFVKFEASPPENMELRVTRSKWFN